MKARDAYYTPDHLADVVAGAFPARDGGVYVDPAAGHGSLLRGVRRRFSSATLWALDVDGSAVDRLRSDPAIDLVSRADFLNRRSVSSSVVGRARMNVSGVVINPPFSYRGGSKATMPFGGHLWALPVALRFLVRAVEQFSPHDGIVAVLPLGSYVGEKYQSFWEHLRSLFEVVEVARPSTGTFSGTRASSVVVRIGAHAPRVHRLGQVQAFHRGCVEVVRGRVQVHAVRRLGVLATSSESGTRFIHTSDLSRTRGRSARAITSVPLATTLVTLGPMVVVHRVGSPRWGAPLVVESEAVLSDCVFALRPRGNLSVESLLAIITDAWASFDERFGGTGSPYITVKGLIAFLADLGLHGEHLRASAAPSVCAVGCEKSFG